MAQDPLAPVGASANPNARGYATPIVFDLALPYKLGYEQKKLREKQAADARKASQDEFFKFNKEMYRDVDAPEALRPIFNRQRDKYLSEFDAIRTTPEGRNAIQFVTTGSIIDARGNVRENLNDKEREQVQRLTRIQSGIGKLVKAGAAGRKYEDAIRQQELQGVDFVDGNPFEKVARDLDAAEQEGRDVDVERSLSLADRALRTFDVVEFNKKFAEEALRRQSQTGAGWLEREADGLIKVTNRLDSKNAEGLADDYLQEIQGRIRTEAGRKRVQNARPDWFLPNGELNPQKVKEDADRAIPGLKSRMTVSAFSPSAGGDPRSPKSLGTRILSTASSDKNIAAVYQPFPKPLPLRDDETGNPNLVPIDNLGEEGQIIVIPVGQSYVGRTRDGRYVPFPASHPNPRKYLEERGVVEVVPADLVNTINVQEVGQDAAEQYKAIFGDLASGEVQRDGRGVNTQVEILAEAERASKISAKNYKRALQVASDTRQPGLPLSSPDLNPFFRLITRSDAPASAPAPSSAAPASASDPKRKNRLAGK